MESVLGRVRGVLRPVDDPPEDSKQTGQSEDVLFDEEFLARLRRLVVLSRRSLSQGIAGEHRSRRKGTSPAFSDFKSYSQGDDFRRIDWNIYSRLDELFVRLSEVTTEQTVHFLVDSSDSMAWKGSNTVPTKRAYARKLVGALGYASLWKFDRVIVTPFGSDLSPSFGPLQGRSHANTLLVYLTNLGPMPGTDVSASMQRYVGSRRSPGLLFLISDLLSCEPETLQEDLHHVRTRGWSVVVVHVIDSAELSPGLAVPRRSDLQPTTLALVESETGSQMRLTPTREVIERYESVVTQWLTDIEHACTAEGMTYVPLHTHWSFESLVLTTLYEAGVVA